MYLHTEHHYDNIIVMAAYPYSLSDMYSRIHRSTLEAIMLPPPHPLLIIITHYPFHDTQASKFNTRVLTQGSSQHT